MSTRQLPTRKSRISLQNLLIFGSLAIAMVVAVGLLASVLLDTDKTVQCDSTDVVKVGVEPAILEQVQQMASEAESGSCYRYQVSEMTTAEIQTLVEAEAPLPHIWIPDADFRLSRAGQLVDSPFETIVESLASSPIVVVHDNAVSVKTQTWAEILSTPRLKLGDPLKTGTADGPILASTAEIERGLADKKALDESLSLLAQSQAVRNSESVPDQMDLITQVNSKGGAAVVSEQQALKFMAENPGHNLSLATAETGAVFLSYPMAVTSQEAGGRQIAMGAAKQLATSVKSPNVSAALTSAHFRAVDQTPTDDESSVGDIEQLEVKDDKTLSNALRRWNVLAVPSRTLILMDTSGSMNTMVPGINKTRIQLTMESAGSGLGLFPSNAQLGSWAFSSGNKDGKGKPYIELSPVQRLDTITDGVLHRTNVALGASKLSELIEGGTDLFTTLGDAYTLMQKTYDPNAVNSLIVLTDGANDNVSPISDEEFFNKLTDMQDPKRPVRVVTIGLMEDADPTMLAKISEITGGTHHIARTPNEIPKVFAAAMANR